MVFLQLSKTVSRRLKKWARDSNSAKMQGIWKSAGKIEKKCDFVSEKCHFGQKMRNNGFCLIISYNAILLIKSYPISAIWCHFCQKMPDRTLTLFQMPCKWHQDSKTEDFSNFETPTRAFLRFKFNLARLLKFQWPFTTLICDKLISQLSIKELWHLNTIF